MAEAPDLEAEDVGRVFVPPGILEMTDESKDWDYEVDPLAAGRGEVRSFAATIRSRLANARAAQRETARQA